MSTTSKEAENEVQVAKELIAEIIRAHNAGEINAEYLSELGKRLGLTKDQIKTTYDQVKYYKAASKEKSTQEPNLGVLVPAALVLATAKNSKQAAGQIVEYVPLDKNTKNDILSSAINLPNEEFIAKFVSQLKMSLSLTIAFIFIIYWLSGYLGYHIKLLMAWWYKKLRYIVDIFRPGSRHRLWGYHERRINTNPSYYSPSP